MSDRGELLLAMEDLVESKLKTAFLDAGRRPSSAASTARILTPTVMHLLFEHDLVEQARDVLGRPA